LLGRQANLIELSPKYMKEEIANQFQIATEHQLVGGSDSKTSRRVGRRLASWPDHSAR
jgi:hypothetical protein